MYRRTIWCTACRSPEIIRCSLLAIGQRYSPRVAAFADSALTPPRVKRWLSAMLRYEHLASCLLERVDHLLREALRKGDARKTILHVCGQRAVLEHQPKSDIVVHRRAALIEHIQRLAGKGQEIVLQALDRENCALVPRPRLEISTQGFAHAPSRGASGSRRPPSA